MTYLQKPDVYRLTAGVHLQMVVGPHPPVGALCLQVDCFLQSRRLPESRRRTNPRKLSKFLRRCLCQNVVEPALPIEVLVVYTEGFHRTSSGGLSFEKRKSGRHRDAERRSEERRVGKE